MVIVGTFDGVTLFKNEPGKGWVNLLKDAVTYRAQLKHDDEERLVMVFRQKEPENKKLYEAAVTKDTILKKLRDDFIQIQITTGVVFGLKFKDKDFINPDLFLSHFKNSDATVIEQVGQSLAAEQKSKPVDTTGFRTDIGPRRDMHQAPPPLPHQNVAQNWSGNQQQQQPQQQTQPMNNRTSGTQHGGGAHYAGGGSPLGGGGSPFGVGGSPFGPGGGAQRRSQELKSPPIKNQPQQQDQYPMGGGPPYAGGRERQRSGQQQMINSPTYVGGDQRWSGHQQPSATPPKNVMQAWGENQRQQSNESTQPQSPAPKPEATKKIPVKSRKELENYAQLLEAALTDTDKDYVKTIVKLLVEAKTQQKNFSIKFLNADPYINYFRLKVTIEREIAPNEKGILFFLMVTEDFTIEQLQLMIETRFSISHEQQHWIIGNQFATNKESRLKDFGLRGRGAEVHLFISKGEVGDVTSSDDHVSQNDTHYQRNQNDIHYQQQESQFYGLQYVGPSPPRQWQGGPNVQDHYPQGQVYSTQNYNNQPSYPSNYGDTGGFGGGQQFGGNHFTPESIKMPPRLPTPPPAPRPVTPPPPPGWKCGFCSALNVPYRPGCQLCSSDRPADYRPPPGYQPTKEEEKWISDNEQGIQKLEELEREQRDLQARQARENYEAMMAVARKNLVPNDEKFECPICYIPIEVGEGVKLRECLHCCCKDCLHDHIMASTDADVLCPCNDQFACGGSITEAEMRELLDDEELDKVHSRGLNLAEGQSRSYHCKTPDCRGFCFYEDNVNDFNCMVCGKRNCLLCKAIHAPQSCKEYQEDLRIKAANDKAAQETQKMIEDMVKNGDAMYCPNPNCGLIIQKKNGCDWIRCSCRTEICWVTKGPRWGPKGHGDTSGGCRCKVDKKKCHPKCGNCH